MLQERCASLRYIHFHTISARSHKFLVQYVYMRCSRKREYQVCSLRMGVVRLRRQGELSSIAIPILYMLNILLSRSTAITSGPWISLLLSPRKKTDLLPSKSLLLLTCNPFRITMVPVLMFRFIQPSLCIVDVYPYHLSPYLFGFYVETSAFCLSKRPNFGYT